MAIDEQGIGEVMQNTSDSAVDYEVKPKKEKQKKKKTVAYSRSSVDKSVLGLLIAILAVGLCLLCVSVVGMIGVSSDLNKAPVAEGTTPAPIETQPQQNSNTPVNTQPENTTAPQDTENTTAAPAPDENADQNAAAAPQSDAEWLTFFNNAVNKLKTDAPSMTKAKQTKTADIQLSNPLGQTVVSVAKDKYLSDEVVETPIAKGDAASAVANISPDGASFVSNLSVADVKSVSGSTDVNGNYVITIAMPDLTNPELSSAYGKIFEFMTVDDVMDTYAPDMGATVDRSNVSLVFTDCSASATISPDGKVISYQTTVNANMILKDAKISVITTDVDARLFSETKYTNIGW